MLLFSAVHYRFFWVIRPLSDNLVCSLKNMVTIICFSLTFRAIENVDSGIRFQHSALAFSTWIFRRSVCGKKTKLYYYYYITDCKNIFYNMRKV